jgi:putative phosphoribosyl transferase
MTFKNRQDAGKQLSEKLAQYKNNSNTIVLGLPRGGVVVAFEIAQALHLPMDIIVPRKIGAPGNPELAIGAITEDGEGIFDERMILDYGVSQDYLTKEIQKEKQEALRRLKLYRGTRSPLHLKNKIALLVDDGIATGATMRAAIKSAKAKDASKIIVAIPTAANDSLEKIKKEADEVLCLDAPPLFFAIGEFYQDFPQIEDKEVIDLMSQAKRP